MEIILFIIGAFIGILSGFFGIGGGTVLVPILLLLGFGMKEAVGISITQMVFSSIYGSYLNIKKGSLALSEGLFVGLGGFLGGYLSSYFTPYVPEKVLQFTFLAFVIFAIIKVALSKPHTDESLSKTLPKPLLFLIGAGIGIVAISIGVGGSIILVPLLSGLLHYPIKKAVSAGLFFVVFSSVAGFLGRILHTGLNLKAGIIVGVGSLIGVWIGIWLKEKISTHHHKRFIVGMYSVILLLMVYKMFFAK
jgi:uncharacterized membrane protein YfcA